MFQAFNPSALISLGLLFVLVVLFVLLRPVYLTSKTLSFFRVFFPSWKFFDEVSTDYILEYRKSGVDKALPWLQAIEAPRRELSQLILNAEGNLFLAKQSLLRSFLYELAEEQENPVTLELLRALVLEAGQGGESCLYEFRIREHSADKHSEECDMLYQSIPFQGAKACS